MDTHCLSLMTTVTQLTALVLTPYGFHNKELQTDVKNKIYSLIVLEARSLKSRCVGRVTLSLKPAGKYMSLAFPASDSPRKPIQICADQERQEGSNNNFSK